MCGANTQLTIKQLKPIFFKSVFFLQQCFFFLQKKTVYPRKSPYSCQIMPIFCIQIDNKKTEKHMLLWQLSASLPGERLARRRTIP